MEVRSCPPYFFGQVMPIQPRAPSFKLNCRSNPDQLSARCSGVRFGMVSARNWRTSRRSCSHSGGRVNGGIFKFSIEYLLSIMCEYVLEALSCGEGDYSPPRGRGRRRGKPNPRRQKTSISKTKGRHVNTAPAPMLLKNFWFDQIERRL